MNGGGGSRPGSGEAPATNEPMAVVQPSSLIEDKPPIQWLFLSANSLEHQDGNRLTAAFCPIGAAQRTCFTPKTNQKAQ
jgi:hypothetical protein